MLIQTDEQLRQYMPNVFSTATGEPTLFEKMTTFLENAEGWFVRRFAPSDLLEELRDHAAPVIAYEAFLRAAPMLNVVLTPNGFATVGTNDVVAASTARTEALAEGLKAQRDNCIAALLNELPGHEGWLSTAQADYFGGTLFPNLDLVKEICIGDNIWDEYVGHIALVRDIEFCLGQRFLSPELLSALRKENLRGTLTPERAFVVMVMKNQIIKSLRSSIPCNDQYMMDAVQFIRTHRESFPEWHSSETARLFTPPIFKNTKHSTGYFF